MSRALLARHRATKHADYDNLGQTPGARDELVAALLRDQKDLCCYCMSRIMADDVRVEHHVAQSRDPSRQLDWRNLLAACPGGGAQGPRAKQHCDVHKGDEPLTLNPIVASTLREIEYGADGTITSTRASVRNELNDILNLNMSELREARGRALATLFERWTIEGGDQTEWRRGDLERWRRELQRLAPDYCGIGEYFLRKLMAR